MSNLVASFAGLVKTNNGEFKSEKQASFLLSNCVDGAFKASGEVYGNTFNVFYYCDSVGIYKVVKSTKKADTLTWERKKGDEAEAAKAGAKKYQDNKKKMAELQSKLDEAMDAERVLTKLIYNGEVKPADIMDYIEKNITVTDDEKNEIRNEIKEVHEEMMKWHSNR